MKFKKIKSKELLIFELNHFCVSMAIVRRKGKKTEILAHEKTNSLAPLEGAQHCLQQLKKKKRLPKQVFMVSTEAIPALINLKFYPGQTTAEQEELVRWEMEDSLNTFTKTPDTDTLLDYPGFLQTSQLERLKEYENEQDTLSPTLEQRLKDASILDNVDFEEIVDFTEQWPHADEAAMCAWTNSFSEKTKNDHYLSAYIGTPRRDMWLDFFDQQGLSLCGTIPWSLSTLTLLNKEDIEKHNLFYVEEHPGYWVSARIRKGLLISMQTYEITCSQFLPKTMLEDIDTSESTAICLNSKTFNFDQIKDALSPKTKVEMQIPLAVPPEKIILQAAARQAWQLPSHIKQIVLPTVAPPQPLRKRPEIWWVAVILSAAMFYSALVFSWIKELKKLDVNYKNLQKEIKAFATNFEENENNKKKIAKLKKDISQNKTSIKTLKLQLERAKMLNSDFVIQFLNSFKKASIENLRILSFNCQRQGSFKIYGECVTETAAYKLSRLLTTELKLAKPPVLSLNQQKDHFIFNIQIIAAGRGK
ncbi:MAG: hypothetical protein MK132_17050 [Lentisphaerales bacterium]|nr:hypothetical protein [Lentisphaerales bacterium]